jgi:hypothetical protein
MSAVSYGFLAICKYPGAECKFMSVS